MKIAYSHVDAELREEIDRESRHHIEKLNRLLENYHPDRVEPSRTARKDVATSEYELSLNLVLLTGTLHATGTGADPRASAKMAFAEIETQVKKHQQKLRKDYIWKRKRAGGVLKASEVPSAD